MGVHGHQVLVGMFYVQSGRSLEAITRSSCTTTSSTTTWLATNHCLPSTTRFEMVGLVARCALNLISVVHLRSKALERGGGNSGGGDDDHDR